MKKLLTRFVDIREGEFSRVLLMFSYIFLVICCLLIIKPVRNSLFLTRFGAEQLPYAFILVAAIAAIVTTVYSRYASRVRLNLLIRNSTLILLGNMAFFWILLRSNYEGAWFIYLFYIWSAIFSAIATSQFWILANYVFDSREAKRLFGFLGAGAISGGIFGGYLTSYLAPLIGTENLLLICIAFLGFCLYLLQQVWKQRQTSGMVKRRRRKSPERRSINPLRLVTGSRHVAYLTGIVAISVTVANLVDYQYNDIVNRNISNRDDITAFLGLWLSNLSLISLAVQLFVTNRILTRLGVSATLFFLPIGILLGATAILFYPFLWAAVAIKMTDGSLKQSINKAGLELLYLPIPSRIKAQVKSFIDVFVDSLSTGLSGVLLIICTSLLGFSVGDISIVTIALILLWLFLIWRIRNEYTQAFRKAIEQRTINLEEQAINVDDASLLNNLLEILESDNKRQIVYVLELLENVKNQRFIPYLQRFLQHPDSDIQKQAFALASHYPGNTFQPEATRLLTSADQQLRAAALDYLFRQTEEKTAFLSRHLEGEPYELRAAALLCLSSSAASMPELRERFDIPQIITSMLRYTDEPSLSGEESEFTRINIARAIALARMPELQPVLAELLHSPQPAVAAQAALSAAQIGDTSYIPALVELLGHKEVRGAARAALAEFGDTAIAPLMGYLAKPELPRRIRQSIIRAIAMTGEQQAVDALTNLLVFPDFELRYDVVKGLSNLRKNYPTLSFNNPEFDSQILQECREYIQLINLLYSQHKSHDTGEVALSPQTQGLREARALLIKALEEKLDSNLEQVFRLLGLKYPQSDMFNAYMGVVSTKQESRANAVEFLDNVLEPNLKLLIIPIVENTSLSSLSEMAQNRFKLKLPDKQECLEALLNTPDHWVLCCTIFLIAQLREGSLRPRIEPLGMHPDMLVRETANLALQRLPA